MLSIFDGNRPISRRQLLTVGSLGMAGLSLPSLLAGSAEAGQSPRHITGKSVIFLFQQGGPSQFETFDPKPDAPSGVRTLTPVIRTKTPGVIFGDTMDRLAGLSDKFTVVRSFQTNNSGHNIQPIVSNASLQANIGVHYSRMVGATHSTTGMPTNAILHPSAVDPDVPGPSARGDLKATGKYGSGFAPFMPGSKGQLQQNMHLSLPKERLFEDRRSLLAALDRLNRQVDASGGLQSMDELQQQAYRLLLGGGVSEAMDLSKEDPKVVARYDTSHFARKGQWNDKSRGRSGYFTSQAQTIGKLLLLARRMCEAGCGFITIHAGYSGVWDMHADGNNLNMVDGMNAVGRSYDHAVAAFINDLEARGLSDKILLVTTGEMGRTPKVNKNGGRDHWSKLAPLLLYGGGIKGGRVIGRSTRNGGEPATENFGPESLISTIMHTLFDVGQLRLVQAVQPQLTKLVEQKPIVVPG